MALEGPPGASVDATHDPALRSWVPTVDGHPDFPVQNLPVGVFSPAGGRPRGGVAVGDWILDLSGLASSALLEGDAASAAEAASAPTLNALVGLGARPRAALRAAVSRLLTDARAAERVRPLLWAADGCAVHLPCAIGDYTDFYAGIHHAENVGRQFRPDAPLLPNYKHVPIGYHGRASSVRPSGTDVVRPRGQTKAADDPAPRFGPTRRLDYELEMGVWIGPGNAPGEPIPIGRAAGHVAGFCLLNDWSARDVQAWEYQPLGPFLAKSFATTVSCWMITPEALAPFRLAQAARPAGDPDPLPYLIDAADQDGGAIDLELDVLLATRAMRERGIAPQRVGASNARHMYWTVAQLVAHHASGGCDLRPGDLLGTGTISGPDAESCGSLLETSLGGRRPVPLPTGEERCFLEDGDEVTLRARARRDGFAPVGFGACRAVVLPARAAARGDDGRPRTEDGA